MINPLLISIVAGLVLLVSASFAAQNHQGQTDAMHAPVFRQAPQPPRPGQDHGLSLTLEQAVFMVLKNNRDLHVRQFAPAIAGTFEQIELGTFDPELFADLSWAREMDDSTAQDRIIETRAGVTKKFISGTRLTADLAYDKDSSEDDGSRHNTRAELSVTQALLRGAGVIVNLAGVRQRKLDTLASIYELKGFTEALVARTEAAYWNYVLALKEIEIFQRSLEVAAQQREEAELRIQVGLLPENEAAAARSEEAIREQALIDAASLVEERRLTLLQLINVKNADEKINPLSRPAIHADAMGKTSERVDLALSSRPDLKEAELKLTRDELEVMVTENGILPKLDFFMNLGINGFGNSPGESIEDISTKKYDIGAGITTSRYMGNRQARARHRAAALTRQQAETAVDNLRHNIRFQVCLAVNEVKRTRQQIFASRKTRECEEQTVVSEQERFKVGSGTSLLVAQAQRDLLASQIAEARAVINYRIALVNLFLSEGSLLERRGISIKTDKDSGKT